MQRLMGLLHKRIEVGVAIIALVLVVGFTVGTRGVWLSSANLREVLRVTAILAIMAFGVALVITTGEIDISVGSTFGLVGITYLTLASQIGALPAILVVLVLAVAIGALNGFIVAYFRIPSLIVTLGGLFVFRGLAYAELAGTAFSANDAMRADPFYRFFGGGAIFGYNNAFLWALVIVLILNYVLFLTPIGNRLLGMGGNAPSAHSRGVRIRRIKMGAFIACAVFAGLAGILEASDLGFADASFGLQREMPAIAAAVLGGTVLTGGRTSVIGAFIGAFILSGIQSYLVINHIQPQWYTLLLGLIVVLVGLADRGLTYTFTRLAR